MKVARLQSFLHCFKIIGCLLGILQIPWISKISWAEEDWEVIANENDITIEKRKLATESLIEVRARGKIDAPMAAVMNVLNDSPRYPEWMKNSKEPKLIGVLPSDSSSRIFYNRVSPSWLLQDRDYYLVVRVRCARLQKQIQLEFSTDPSLSFPEQKKVVRMNDLHGHWYFHSVGSHTYGEYQLYVDIGGSLIKSIKNYAVKKMALQAFANFREQVYKTKNLEIAHLKQDFPQLFPSCISE